MSGASNDKYRFYQCGQYKAKGATACKAYSINADFAEKQVLDELKRTIDEPCSIINHASAIEIKQLLSLFEKNIQITKEPISSEYHPQKSCLITKINLLFDFKLNL
ncbi:zinc ribbon domain-containing protein [Bacillus spizizenii]|uniref:zinc ribbon domain-containing protein n=1 Tax=Bacillus spizizenii TaxID=96241 RepID=UPI003558D9F5